MDLQLKYIRAMREETIFKLNKIVQEVKLPFRVYLPVASLKEHFGTMHLSVKVKNECTNK